MAGIIRTRVTTIHVADNIIMRVEIVIPLHTIVQLSTCQTIFQHPSAYAERTGASSLHRNTSDQFVSSNFHTDRNTGTGIHRERFVDIFLDVGYVVVVTIIPYPCLEIEIYIRIRADTHSVIQRHIGLIRITPIGVTGCQYGLVRIFGRLAYIFHRSNHKRTVAAPQARELRDERPANERGVVRLGIFRSVRHRELYSRNGCRTIFGIVGLISNPERKFTRLGNSVHKRVVLDGEFRKVEHVVTFGIVESDCVERQFHFVIIDINAGGILPVGIDYRRRCRHLQTVFDVFIRTPIAVLTVTGGHRILPRTSRAQHSHTKRRDNEFLEFHNLFFN